MTDDVEFKSTLDEIEDNDTTKLKYDIILSAADLTTEDLNKKMIDGIIDIPKFQRDYVWNLKDASKLIDSFMMGLPIPPIFLYLQKNQKYLLIDGGQRLRTIQYFYKGIFNPERNSRTSKTFRLEGLHPQNPLLNRTYESFIEEDKQFFKNQVLRAIIIRQIQPEDNTSIYHIFERLNTGGVPLKDQEVRNCVYGGLLNDLLIELNDYTNWRLFLGKPQKLPRQKDVELILRYMALLHESSTYQRPMKDFLSEFMAKNENASAEFLNMEEERFKKVCDMVIDKFGERSLHKKGSFPTAVFDCIFVALGRNYERIPNDLKDRIDRLRADEEFGIVTTKATMDVGKIHRRIELAEKYIFDMHV
jgi:uncharacterized protein with ParB-like and HNH nuclease domain